MAKTKGKLVEGLAMILKTGSTIVGGMSWETPYVEFLLHGGGTAKWISDHAAPLVGVKPETIVNLRGFVRGTALNQTLYRVTVTSKNAPATERDYNILVKKIDRIAPNLTDRCIDRENTDIKTDAHPDFWRSMIRCAKSAALSRAEDMPVSITRKLEKLFS